jgi:hypothetical protein
MSWLEILHKERAIVSTNQLSIRIFIKTVDRHVRAGNRLAAPIACDSPQIAKGGLSVRQVKRQAHR